MTKNIIVFYVLELFCLFTLNISKVSAQVDIDSKDKRPTLHNNEYSSIQEYIAKNTHYPEIAKVYQVEGQVMIIAEVDTDGSIKGASISKDIGHGCGAEGLRVINSLPKLSPVIHDGKPIKVYVRFPIEFKFKTTSDTREELTRILILKQTFLGVILLFKIS